MSERGTVLPVLALVMVGGALAVALTVEVGRCGAAWREASFAADAGADFAHEIRLRDQQRDENA